MRKHPRRTQLDEYTFDRLTGADLVTVEEHLLICEPCWRYVELEDEFRGALVRAHSLQNRTRKGLWQCGPLKFVHHTADGPIFSEVTRLGKGKWSGRHWGRQLDGSHLTSTLWEANEYLLDSFVQMFPEHRCTRRCGMLRCVPW